MEESKKKYDFLVVRSLKYEPPMSLDFKEI